MKRVIVNDASCLIDLRKGRLLHVMMRLPYQFVIPWPVRESELLDLTAQEWRMLDDSGLVSFDLPEDAVAEAYAVKTEIPSLSANDCFCLITTLRHGEALLLTGDRTLRRAAEKRSLEVHGVLWMLDKLHLAQACEVDLLLAALGTWRDDPAVFLPGGEIEVRLRRLRR